MKLSGIRQEGNGVEWGAPIVPIGVEKGVGAGGNPELDVPVVIVGVGPADVVVVVLTPGPIDPVEAEGDETLAVVVVGVPVVVIGEDMVVCFWIFTPKFSQIVLTSATKYGLIGNKVQEKFSRRELSIESFHHGSGAHAVCTLDFIN